MHSTQLACPHCGSMLNFGTSIAPGTTVECLICMQSFAAQPGQSGPAPAVGTVAEKPTPKRPPIGKPQLASRPAPPAAGTPAKSSKAPLVAVLCLLLLVAGGAGSIVLWKFLTPPVANPDDLVDENPNKDALAKGNPPVKKDGKPAEIGDDDDARKLKDLEKKQLERKVPVESGGAKEPDWTVLVKEDGTEVYPGVSPRKVKIAIDRGVEYLKKTQRPTGTWAEDHAVGHAGLGGLTLLECGVPTNDISVQRAASYVRSNAGDLDKTYDLALAVMFLDRLGDPGDRALIQGMAIRLLAGHTDCGGWTYTCPLLPPRDMYDLFAFLHSNTRSKKPDTKASDAAKAGPAVRLAGNDPNSPFSQLDSLLRANPLPAEGIVLRADRLKAELQMMPVVKYVGAGKERKMARDGTGDNSNTQFALLALWAARRHGVPVDAAILSAYARFVGSHNEDGGWAYHPTGITSGPSMTCVGMLGLAMGHDVAPDILKFNPKDPKLSTFRPAVQDVKVQAALKALSSHIGEPRREVSADQFSGAPDLYFFWSVERVAMLFDQKTINGKDWYSWGAQILIHRQNPEGAWEYGQFTGANAANNSCFALLFLRRSNLVQDLTNNIRFRAGIRVWD